MAFPNQLKKFLLGSIVALFLISFSHNTVFAITPTPTPTVKPTPTPTPKPLLTPTKSPTLAPTKAPTAVPTKPPVLIQPTGQSTVVQKILTVVKQTVTNIQNLFKKPKVVRRKKPKKPVITLTKSKKIPQAIPTPKKIIKPKVLNAQ